MLRDSHPRKTIFIQMNKKTNPFSTVSFVRFFFYEEFKRILYKRKNNVVTHKANSICINLDDMN